jgi:hypothetical protein
MMIIENKKIKILKKKKFLNDKNLF